MPRNGRDGMLVKKRINSGETVLGASIQMVPDRGRLESILESGPYDFLWVDGQHAPYSEDRLVSFCAVTAELGVPTMFRIKSTLNTHLIGNHLDLGPAGIEVPQVEKESTVDEAISSFYYSPTGIRSWGGVYRLGVKERSDRLEYARWWGETGILWMQVESVAAVTDARVLAKPGVDCLSFGPMDLSFSLEAHPKHPFKTVDDCVRHVVEQLEDTDVAVCFRNLREDRQKYIDMGVRVLLEAVK